MTLPDVIELPATAEVNEHTPMARVWFRFRLVMPMQGESADPAFAVYGTRMMGGAYAVWVNGRLLHANLNDRPMQFNSPLYVPLPLEMTAPGQGVEVLIAMPYRLKLTRWSPWAMTCRPCWACCDWGRWGFDHHH